MSTGPNDNEIISRILRGETALYATLVSQYQSFVFSICLRFVTQREDAEEIAQDVFVKAYRYLGDFRGDSKFSTWLYSITHTSCISFLRKKKLALHSLDNEKVFAAADNLDSGASANLIEKKSTVQMLHAAMNLLNPDDARLLTLFYKGEQSLEEIGLILGIEPNTAKVKLHRARQRLKEKMEKHFAAEVRDIKNG